MITRWRDRNREWEWASETRAELVCVKFKTKQSTAVLRCKQPLSVKREMKERSNIAPRVRRLSVCLQLLFRSVVVSCETFHPTHDWWWRCFRFSFLFSTSSSVCCCCCFFCSSVGVILPVTAEIVDAPFSSNLMRYHISFSRCVLGWFIEILNRSYFGLPLRLNQTVL